MKSSLFVTVLALIALFGVVNSGPSCRHEITKYIFKNLVCAERGTNIQGFAGKLAQGEITYEELAEKITKECKLANSGSCYNDISTPIDGNCNDAESVQHFRNAFKTVLTSNEYMCQNNGLKYLDFVKNGGAECYFNDEKARCYNNGKDVANIGELTLTDANVCHVINVDWDCLYHYSECENKNVYTFYQQILRLLREKFSC